MLKLANRAVDQLINADPSIYLSPFTIANKTIRARMGSGIERSTNTAASLICIFILSFNSC